MQQALQRTHRGVRVVSITGRMGDDERRAKVDELAQESTRVLVATDCLSEGINLQHAFNAVLHYDLPWNPNRIEQRFGRIHRIGQTEVCHLWNLVAEQTREGDVYRRLLEKLEQAREALGGQVFDVLGRLQFEGKSLRELLIEAVRYGERPDVQAFLTTVLDAALDRDHRRDAEPHGPARPDRADQLGVGRRVRPQRDLGKGTSEVDAEQPVGHVALTSPPGPSRSRTRGLRRLRGPTPNGSPGPGGR